MTFEDGEISTLKVVQFVVSASEDATQVRAGPDPHGQDPVIRSQLSEMHSLFAVREEELIELRVALQRAIGEKDAELAKARIEWELEVDRKVAEAVGRSCVHDRQESAVKQPEHKKPGSAGELKAERIAAGARSRQKAKVSADR